MKPVKTAPVRKKLMEIEVDATDHRKARVVHDGKVLFTIKTDLSGANPAIVVVAAETHLKTMTKGKTGIVLWNGNAGMAQ